MKLPSEPEKSAKTIGRFRKVEVRTWGDEKFRRLSPIAPCGQGLWLFLITGPHTGPIPGLFRAGRAALAEDLDWEQEAFDKAFQEVLTQGMVKADFKARVVWVPKAIVYNKPESPNVVKSWGTQFDLIPECDLKWIAFEALKAHIHGIGEAYGKAFDEAFGKAFRKTMPNQEQEQEQEQKKYCSEPLAHSKPAASASLALPNTSEPQGLPGLPREPVTSFLVPLVDATEFAVPVRSLAEWREAYPGVDVPGELRKMRAWVSANPTKRKTRRGVSAFIVNWLTRAQDKPAAARNFNQNGGATGNAWDGAK